MIENRYTGSDENVKEMYSYIFFKSPMNIFLGIVCLAGLLVETIIFAVFQHFPLSYIASIALVVFIVLYIIISYFSAIKSHRKRQKELHGGYREVVITADEDSLHVTVGKDESARLYFSQIKKGSEDEFYDLVLENKVDVK